MSSENSALHRELYWPTLQAIRDLGGSATRREVFEKVASAYSDEEQAETMPNGRTPRLHYHTAWNLTRLKRIGLIENSRQGVWAVTERGLAARQEDEASLWEENRAAYKELRRQRLKRSAQEARDDHEEDDSNVDVDMGADAWKDELLETIKELTPSGFERLCQRLLREAGVENVRVLGGSGDQGIDGVGLVSLGLLNFPVYFQAKKYDRTVTPSAVRDFRGTMAGRGEKGLLITTAGFTAAAHAEATRDGVPPIDLIDGSELCDLLKRYELGVDVEVRTVEDVSVRASFWEAFE